ncbi:DUF1939 domain-containing protein [bacterium]|nr:MAG: DUF1939 domain-containing protein [bacterium]
MGVLLQGFYWDCFEEGEWWPRVRTQIEKLAEVGFTGLWLPPVHKGAHIYGAPSMGYDPFDYYDLGEFDQRGRTPTSFGTKAQLLDLIGAAHGAGMTVLADVVFNHCSGGEAEPNPYAGKETYTLFKPASGRFPRDHECFHPTFWETMDGEAFGDMPDLCHRSPYVGGQILDLCRWLVEEVGFDGFRYDMVKGYGSWMVAAIQEQRYEKDGVAFKPFGVGEQWSTDRGIENWLNEVNAWPDNPVSAFDFPLRNLLKEMCDTYGFSMRRLLDTSVLTQRQPHRAVTFVDNHDFRGPTDGGDLVIHDKLLAYAYLLTHEGLPCVFWWDYFNQGLAMEGTPNGIAALVQAHEKYAGGAVRNLWVDDDLYVMQRAGTDAQSGLIVALNNRGDRWEGEWVSTQWRNRILKPVAWWSSTDLGRPTDQPVAADGRAQIWAPPRGYVVYAVS